MSINIRFQLKSSEPKNYKFDDDIVEITLGRDPALCQVVFPAEETLVGRQHCVINELAGRYRLETTRQSSSSILKHARELGSHSSPSR